VAAEAAELQIDRTFAPEQAATRLVMSTTLELTTEAAGTQSAFTGARSAETTYPALKRLLDLALALLAIVALAPVFAVIAVSIVVDSGFPILYRQERVGRNGCRFPILKFRSMRAGANSQVHVEYVQSLLRAEAPCARGLYKIGGDKRVTRVGSFLRRSSLDELPQLWNVVRGEMSLVGPRPDVPYSVEEYAPWALRRFEVQPGITGLWQVSGRSKLSIQEMLRLDVAYVDRRSLRLDIEILLRTIPAVISKSGAA